MDLWFTVVLIVDVIVALCIIGLVLLQHGKGADVGAAFGSGASGSLFGASGSANFLSRTTAMVKESPTAPQPSTPQGAPDAGKAGAEASSKANEVPK